MNWLRAIAVWLLIIVTESIHGTIRQWFVAPLVGDKLAGQMGVLIGSALIFLISWLTARWLDAKTFKDQLRTGTLWVVLTFIFEISLGNALGYTCTRMLSAYNLAQGGLMGLGMLFMFFAPALATKLRSTSNSSIDP